MLLPSTSIFTFLPLSVPSKNFDSPFFIILLVLPFGFPHVKKHSAEHAL